MALGRAQQAQRLEESGAHNISLTISISRSESAKFDYQLSISIMAHGKLQYIAFRDDSVIRI